jgi:membrane associated rhomboid family serine protease
MLLLLPYRDRSVAHNLPTVTILIALACIVVMLGFNGRDAAREQQAYSYYQDSGLGGIELPRYQAYLAGHNDAASAERLRRLRSIPPKGATAVVMLQGDAHFLGELRAQHIVPPDDPVFADWRDKRQHFEEMLHATVNARFSLSRADAGQVWRFVTYGFLHANAGHLLGNLLVLILVGPFVESALGHLRFAGCYLAGGAAAGALHLLVSGASVIGASGAIAATVGMLAVLYGASRVPVFYWVFFVFGTTRIPALALLPVWLINEGYQWTLQSQFAGAGAGVAYGAHVGGLCAGAALAWLLRPSPSPEAAARSSAAEARRADSGSALAAQAQDAASRLDIRRATRLYRQLVELEPTRTDYLGAYLNVTLLGADEDALQDAALRLLWNKFRKPTAELRKTFQQLTQDKVLKVLPIDEHLRLARRLVKFREDAAALRVIDALLRDEHTRKTFGRQLADCLLGIFTAYSRHGLQTQAEQISTRLSTYFPTGSAIGGMAPANRPPPTIVTMFRNTAPGFAMTQPDSEDRRPAPPTLPGSSQG